MDFVTKQGLTNPKKLRIIKVSPIFRNGTERKVHHMTDILAPDDPALQSMADLFKVFGDPTRVRILFALFQQEACVQEIANRLGMTQSAISHQLRILKQARLVSSRREGKSIFYALADDHIYTIFRQALEHIAE